jgi:hypothetical protein
LVSEKQQSIDFKNVLNGDIKKAFSTANSLLEKFYDDKKLTLPHYQELQTPQHILEFYERLDVDRVARYSFIKASLNYAFTPGSLTEYAPFYSHGTTFQSMSRGHLNFYFYWRQQAINGIYIKTNLSYVILFAYELINYSFNKSASFNASMIERLQHGYKERIPEVNKYLNVWLSDLLIEAGRNDLTVQLEDQQNGIPRLYTEIKEHYRDLSNVTFTLWNPYIQNYRETNFFKNYKTRIYMVFRAALPLLQKALTGEGKEIISEWFNIRTVKKERRLFQSAVMNRPVATIFYDDVLCEARSELYRVITALFRISENVARLLQGENREIKADEEMLPLGFKESLLDYCCQQQAQKEGMNTRFNKVQDRTNRSADNLIPQPVVAHKELQPIISFDLNRIEELRSESKELIGIFEELYPSESSDDPLSESPSDLISIEGEDRNVFSFFRKTIGDEEAFITSLSDLEIEFVIGFEQGRRGMDEANRYLKSNSVMPNTFISSLNEKAIEFLGDTILEHESDIYYLQEEFDDVLIKVREGIR